MQTTFASPAIYHGGVVFPQVKPKIPPREVVVVFIGEKKGGEEKGNAMQVLAALERIKGTLPADMDGVAYEDKIRKEMEEHFQQLQW